VPVGRGAGCTESTDKMGTWGVYARCLLNGGRLAYRMMIGRKRPTAVQKGGYLLDSNLRHDVIDTVVTKFSFIWKTYRVEQISDSDRPDSA